MNKLEHQLKTDRPGLPPAGRDQRRVFSCRRYVASSLPEGKVLVRSDYLSLDPYMRGRMDDRKSYATSIAIGAPIEGEAVGVIIESGHPGWPKGTIVTARTGWRTHTIVPTEGLRWINPAAAPVTTAFGVLGMPGFTAYADLKEIGQQKAGDMLVVAAASGPVGSFVSQLHIEPVPAR